VLCERCGTDNPEGVVVCIECYWAVGVPYTARGASKKKDNGKAPAWAAQMGLTDVELRQVSSRLGSAAKGPLMAYWFPSYQDAQETEKALADTIGNDIKSRKARVFVFNLQGRAALFIAGKVEDPATVQMVCDSFNGQPALAEPTAKK
jgi:hypothetical protein